VSTSILYFQSQWRRDIGLFEAIASCLKWVGGWPGLSGCIIVGPQHKYHDKYYN